MPSSIIARGLPLWLALGVCVSVGALTLFGYRSMRAWQTSATLLATRRAGEAADLFVQALTRDMRGAQGSVLVSPNWTDALLDSPNDLRSYIAGAFARYPYPESFFAARRFRVAEAVVFLNRAERHPPWLAAPSTDSRFPVTIARDPELARRLGDRIAIDADAGRLFSIFETTLGGCRYQVVTRLLYEDASRERPAGAFGFTVNLDWVRRAYFTDLTKQVARINAVGDAFDLRVLDESHRVVAASRGSARASETTRRALPLAFFDPMLVALDPPTDLTLRAWAAEIQDVSEPAPGVVVDTARRGLFVFALSSVFLAVGVALAARATRAHARLSEMRSEFVSTVTHELKTPIATIRAVGDTLISGRSTRPDATRHYAQLVVQESKRLARLVDNLLAYARIVDVTEAYTFEPLSPADLVAEAIRRFDTQLAANGFAVTLAIDAAPAVRADAVAMELLLDNIIDNAIRYSTDQRVLAVVVRPGGDGVVIAISDRGVGIGPEDLERVKRKFCRGQRAASTGSGLGLAIADRIVSDHDGRLSITSSAGHGTTVEVWLPRAGEQV